MPLTPFHWGPALFIGLLLFPVLDLPALLISGVAQDIEPVCVVFFRLSLPLHGFFHSYLGASILGVLVAAAVYSLRDLFREVMGAFGLSQDHTFTRTLLTSLLGVYSHTLLDSFMHWDVRPFYPWGANPLLGVVSDRALYIFCTASFLLGLALYASRLVWRPKTRPGGPSTP